MKGQLILIAIVIAGVTVSDTYAQEIDLDSSCERPASEPAVDTFPEREMISISV